MVHKKKYLEILMRILNRLSVFILLVIITVFNNCKNSPTESQAVLEKRSFTYSEVSSAGTFSAGEFFSKALQDSLSIILDSTFKHINIQGISVAVGVPGKGIWTAALQKGNSSVTIDSNTVFHAESTGKIFTSVVILKLIEEGILSFDMTLNKWYSFIPRSDKITIRHLLTHTSGIPSFESCPDYEPENYYEPIEKVNWSIKYPYLFKPGEGFSYCNTGYVLLGLIAEKETGKSFANLLEEYIINPLGLKNTFPITKENKNSVIKVTGHHYGQPLVPGEDRTAPSSAGMIASTPTDIIIFLQALVSSQLISAQSVQEMFTDMIKWPDIQNSVFYGKGIVLFPEVSIEIGKFSFISHNGGSTWMGFHCYLHYVPELNVFACAMLNDYNDAAADGVILVPLIECVYKNLTKY
jgi:CubicO group peptidase (beta-lactamase class C family)